MIYMIKIQYYDIIVFTEKLKNIVYNTVNNNIIKKIISR